MVLRPLLRLEQPRWVVVERIEQRDDVVEHIELVGLQPFLVERVGRVDLTAGLDRSLAPHAVAALG